MTETPGDGDILVVRRLTDVPITDRGIRPLQEAAPTFERLFQQARDESQAASRTGLGEVIYPFVPDRGLVSLQSAISVDGRTRAITLTYERPIEQLEGPPIHVTIRTTVNNVRGEDLHWHISQEVRYPGETEARRVDRGVTISGDDADLDSDLWQVMMKLVPKKDAE